ncbi:MAG: Rne/Rng family ribonuclease [Deltaproteobacteria bacterium]|jgi:ribonuclease E|nr:Rne/Rng family ribonuclease [Deltaproteobacteria bacterium]
MRRLLINTIHSEEKRVAIIEDEKLIALDIVWSDQVQLKGNIYKASITRLEPSLQAAFLDIGSSRNGFLQTNDIHPAYFNVHSNGNSESAEQGQHYRRFVVQDVLKTGQELIVQVVKDERDTKGATLTTNLSIPGRYCVLIIGNQRGGVSRKISDSSQRRQIRQAVQKLRIPSGMGVIVRTAGINKSTLELQKDVDNLLDLWVSIIQKSMEQKSPCPLYKESDIAIRALRDYLTSDIDEVLIDDKEAFDKASDFMSKTAPKFLNRIKHYKENQPLFGKYNIDEQIEEISRPEVQLPSGGSIVITPTEAVVAVDVNSGRSTGQTDVEETAFATNKEAASEIARQLKLRDLGGLVVIDFIDMFNRRHKQIVERIMKEVTKNDKAKIEVGKISKFGLLELSRQRLKSSLLSQSHINCPYCDGRGKIKNTEVVALEALRKIQSTVSTGGINTVKIRMPHAPALFLLNNKKDILCSLEKSTGVQILILADGRIKPDQYELEIDLEKAEETEQRHERVKKTNVHPENDSKYKKTKSADSNAEVTDTSASKPPANPHSPVKEKKTNRRETRFNRQKEQRVSRLKKSPLPEQAQTLSEKKS